MSRKLDAAIAEALGNEVGKDRNGTWIYEKIRSEGSLTEYVLHPLPRYSTDGRDMLELDKEMRARGWQLIDMKLTMEGWRALYQHKYKVLGWASYADTEPIARALAAYKALTGKEWKDE